ncbi:cytochrome b [Stenotrophomonas maltophilia]|uniref:cytochrome b n=1 Tax=Stenotrophomonas maltophilia TaxID=40324 RepID=UPI001C8BD9F7|nr:cytochrome b/b6 domain-containing protein [Stenotrophomonas maltophilia]
MPKVARHRQSSELPLMRYSKAQVLLHWISAVIILWATVSGFYVALLDVPHTVAETIGFFNVSITSVLIPLFAIRVVIAISNHRDAPASGAEWAALIAHAALYLVTTVVLLTGVLMMEREINVFNLVSFPQPIRDPQLTMAFNTAHRYACVVLGGLLFLHIAAVVKHHLSGNAILKRMSW